MIHLVLEGAREQAGPVVPELTTLPIERPDDRPRRSDDGRVETGNAQASFFFELHSLALDELRVDHHHQARRIAPDRSIDDEQPKRHADLRRREADARRGVHRFDHVVDQLVDVVGDLFDRAGRVVEGAVAVSEDGQDHQPNCFTPSTCHKTGTGAFPERLPIGCKLLDRIAAELLDRRIRKDD